MKPEQLGPYRIAGTLGRGGMGVVYEGVNVETDEPAAVKILPASHAEALAFRQRFEAEIEALRKLYHPNIVQLFGFGEQEGVLFYAMELVRGNSLEQELRRGRKFEWREAARIGVQICRALRHAHDRGVVHRDLKPANLLLAADGTVKLSDFGIARLFGNTRVTAVGNILGTAEYMAPEQADGGPIGPRTDLYCLGGVLYALLTRQPPFPAGSLAEMICKHRSEAPQPVRRLAPDVPEEFEQLILQLLEKDPAKRIVNATLVARRLDAMLHALATQPEAAPQPSESQAPSPTSDKSRASYAAPQTHVSAGPRGEASAGPSAGGKLRDTRTLEGAEPSPPRKPSESVELGETRAASEVIVRESGATTDFEELDSPGDEKPTLLKNRFTAVQEEELDRVESAEAEQPWISLHTWVLIAGLVLVAVATWYFLRPPTADALYAKIIRKTADESVTSLLAADPLIDDFLMLFPGDRRGDKLRDYKRQVELYRLERKLEVRTKGRATAAGLLPIQRLYIEAKNRAWLDPEQGLRKFQALVDLYKDRTELTGPEGECVELARQQLRELRQQLDPAAEEGLAEVQSRLKRADELRLSDPETARAIYGAIVELYRDKNWAADSVKIAEIALKQLNSRPKAAPVGSKDSSDP